MGYTSSVYCTASVLTLAAIALDRYHSIVDCLRYDARCTVWRVAGVVLWIWVQAALTSSPPLLGWSSVSFIQPMYSCAVDWAGSPGYTAFVVAFSFVLPAAVILFCYVKIVQVARHHARRICHLHEHFSSNATSKARTADLLCYASGSFVSSSSERPPTVRSLGQHVRPRHHGVLRLFLVIIAFFLCWTPYVGMALVQSVGRAPPLAVTLSYWLVLLNSDINPLLYALLSKRFRGELHNIRRRIWAGSGGAGDTPVARVTAHHPGASSVFTVDAAYPKPEESNWALLPGSISSTSSMTCSLWHCTTKPLGKSQCLQVPIIPQEPEPVSTFFYGQVTVRVEHDVH